MFDGLKVNETTTEQGLFEQIAIHLLNTKRQCMEGGSCLYQRADGHKCAVGAVFRKGEYSAIMERTGNVRELAVAGLLPKRLRPHLDLLQAMQKVHDHVSPLYWRKALKQYASAHNLAWPEGL